MRLTRKQFEERYPPMTQEEIDRANKAGELTFVSARKAALSALEEALKDPPSLAEPRPDPDAA